jgi:galactosylceramidase
MRLLAGLALIAANRASQPYFIDDTRGPARVFDGIGGLSGGGATSVLLPMYAEPLRSQILDYLFLPSFGASLHVLKVEIGSDAQTTNGAEAAHQRDPWEAPNFERGYELWLLAEAKKRNPALITYGLPWTWPRFLTCAPGTLANCSGLGGSPFAYPQRTAAWVVDWVRGAAARNVTIDVVGSWNENAHDVAYTLALREALDAAGFGATRIALSDNHNVDDVAADMARNATFAAAVHALAQHYPGSFSSAAAAASGKPIWASEESSTMNNGVGAGCWAREVNQNWVRGGMTSSIAWNLVAAYVRGTNWFRTGLMSALQPWSGSYGSLSMLWATAHTTQFARPGWHYLPNGTGPGTGSGLLARGGSYVTLQAPGAAGAEFSIVIEKMSPDHSPCVRWHVFNFTAQAENATFQLAGGPARAAQLQLWRTRFSFAAGAPGDAGASFFEQLAPVAVVDGAFTLLVEPDALYTLSTLTTARKGAFPPPPPPAVFPPSHVDDFEGCAPPGEARFFLDQSGKWECAYDTSGGRGVIMQQKTPLKPLPSGGDCRPHSLLGSRDSVNVSLSIDARLAANGSALVAARLVRAASPALEAYAGVVFTVDAAGAWGVADSIGSNSPRASGQLPAGLAPGVWHALRLDVNGSAFSVWVDGAPVLVGADASWAGATGHAGIGTADYGHFTEFDRVALYATQRVCGAGAPAAGDAIVAVPCAAEVGPRRGGQFVFVPLNAATCPLGSPCAGGAGRFALAADASLCLAAAAAGGGGASEPWRVLLAPCGPSGDQVWVQDYVQLYDARVIHNASGRPLCVGAPHVGSAAIVAGAGAPPGLFCGNLVFSGDEQELVSMDTRLGGFCLGTCA